MRPRTGTVEVIVSSIALVSACAAAPPEAVSPAAPAPAASASAANTNAPAAVVERARGALREAGLPADARLASSEPAQWNDSSLGCAQPGMQYLQVITSGYILRFVDGGATHQVHVAGQQAVVCPQSLSGAPKRPRAVRPSEMQGQIDTARNELATLLGVPADEVKLVSTKPMTWPDDAMECGTATSRQQTDGFALAFAVRGQSYIYHTDMLRTFACPRIEAQ